MFHHITEVSTRGPAIPKSVLDLAFLEVASLDYIGFEDDDVKKLGRLRRLKWVNLSGPSVSDDVLARLKELKSLEYVSLSFTNVTADGLAEFQASRPEVNVELLSPLGEYPKLLFTIEE